MNKKIYFNKVQFFDLKKYKDNRGFFSETFNKRDLYNILNIKFKCVQTSLAFSKKDVFRGFHTQKFKPIDQLITVIKGRVVYYFFDIRKKSSTFGKFNKVILSEKNNKALYLPKGFAGGYYCHSKENLILYHHNEFFYKKFDTGFNLLSDSIGLKIPNNIIRSRKDKNLKSFKDFKLLVLK